MQRSHTAGAMQNTNVGDLQNEEYWITVNDRLCRVLQNLYDALVSLGLIWQKQNHRIWIDFICIDQRDLAEKAVQVGRMTDICKNCDFVYAWLGLPANDERLQQAVKLNERVTKHYQV